MKFKFALIVSGCIAAGGMLGPAASANAASPLPPVPTLPGVCNVVGAIESAPIVGDLAGDLVQAGSSLLDGLGVPVPTCPVPKP